MLEIALKAIVAPLFTYAQFVTGTADLGLPVPEVLIIPEQALVQKACGTDQCAVKGWFSNEDSTIYLPDSADVSIDWYARSILLHEMIHYIQHHVGKPSLENDCLTWKVREAQAYRFQYQWLYENKVPVKAPSYNFLLASFRSIRCPPS